MKTNKSALDKIDEAHAHLNILKIDQNRKKDMRTFSILALASIFCSLLAILLMLTGCKQSSAEAEEPEPPLIVAHEPVSRPPPWNPIVVKVKLWYADGSPLVMQPEFIASVVDTISEEYEFAADVTFAWDVRNFRKGTQEHAADFDRAYKFYNQFMARYQRDDTISVGIVPPAPSPEEPSGLPYQYGFATRKCPGIAVVAMLPIYDKLETSHEFKRNVAGGKHEIGHAMNAVHDEPNTCTAMDSGILYCPLPAKFSPESVKAIKKCAKKIGKRAR